MRILHTSDWHVGRTLRGRPRVEEHRDVLAEIAGIAADEHVDIVLVGGDMFDSAAPTPEAEEIVYRALLDLSRTGARVVVIAGNHDGARRLGAVAPLLGLAGVTVASAIARPAEGGVLTVDTAGGERARIVLLPFPSKRQVVRAADLMGTERTDQVVQYAEHVERIVQCLCGDLDASTVNLALAHLTILGATTGGGERLAHTVFEYAVAANVFPSTLQYAALGHLHRCQRIVAACPVQYSGSPLQLDFGEGGDTKCVLLVDAAPGLPARVREVELTSGRRLRTVSATMDELRGLAGTTGDDFLRIRVREAQRAGLADEVRDIFPDAVDVVVDRPEASRDAGEQPDDRTGRSPQELFAAYLAARGVQDPRIEALFAELLEEVR